MDVTELLCKIPLESKVKLATNQRILNLFLDEKTIALSTWPYLMLFKDKHDHSYTLHLLCNDHNIPRLLSDGMKDAIDYHISCERKRDLVSVELICRNNYQHQFLDCEDTS